MSVLKSVCGENIFRQISLHLHMLYAIIKNRELFDCPIAKRGMVCKGGDIRGIRKDNLFYIAYWQ